ncbi:NACHT domain-containing protein [Malikia spinosa]|uniref:NACHT domain-containing protein n=1 Tax=Malikia spinosa TaxID=86180 RepID=UPI000A6E7440|nr:ATP-binding protein [Malikia spinosa]
MTTTWKLLEDHIRGIASLRWAAVCRPEHIDGVDFDGVCRVSPDELIIIEITKERTLQKVRADLNKIIPTKMRLATEGLICRGFVILESEPTDSMVEAGQNSHITVCSAADFERAFFDFKSYDKLRSALPFGSAVDSKTGENDTREFIPVKYIDIGRDKTFTIDEITVLLQRGSHIVLSGDYGTGKSRCVREVYTKLRGDVGGSSAFPLAINLRDHWSSSSALEIIAGHLGNVGLGNSVDNIMRLLNSGHLILLLDGFDEIGTQIHDTRIEDRKALRKRTAQGVRDLIKKCKAGVLITGRSHFFDGNEEMIESLGLSQAHDLSCIEVPETFSAAEGVQYLNALGITAALPEWLPRKPLVFQMLVELETEDIEYLLKREYGQFEFWSVFIYAVCRRESKGVSDSIAPQTIKLILQHLAAKTRYSNTFAGRLTPSDIDSAYQSVVGSVPDQSGRQLLSRMCTLGRIEPESPDRQFIDPNVLDVLRADALISDIASMSEKSGSMQWSQSLRFLGTVHAAQMIRTYDLDQLSFSYLHKFGASRNTKRLGEIVSALCLYGEEPLDFRLLTLVGSMMPILMLSHRTVSNLIVRQSEIELLILDGTPINTSHDFSLEDCIISSVAGVSAHNGLPIWIKGAEVISFERLSNSARIKESSLTPGQKLFLSMIHKIFFQPGAGREEGALLKGGYGQKYHPKLADSILKILIKQGVVERFKGDDGWVYKPVRRFTERMNRIRSELTLSEDNLWKEVSLLVNPR